MSVSERWENTMNSDINCLQRRKSERNHDEVIGSLGQINRSERAIDERTPNKSY